MHTQPHNQNSSFVPSIETRQLSTYSSFTHTGTGSIAITTYPDKDKYDAESDWLKAMALYFIYKSEAIMRKRYDMNERSKRLYNAITDASKIPSYAVGKDNISYSDITYEHLNALHNPIQVRIGEIASKGFNVNVSVNAEEAHSRKEQVRAELFLKKYTADNHPDLMSEDEKARMRQIIDVEKIMGGYRDTYELAIERALNEWMERTNFDDWYRQTGLTYLLTNTAHGVPSIDPFTFEVKLPYIDPSTFVPDVDCKDDYFKEGRYYIHFDYQSLGATLQMYPDLDKDAIIKKGNANSGMNTILGYPTFRRNANNHLDQILVLRCYFIYNDEYESEETEIKGYGLEIQKESDNEPIIKQNIEKETKTNKYPYECVYYCELLGGEWVIKGGKMPYQQRSMRMPACAQLNAQTLCLNYNLAVDAPPMPVRIEALQAYRNALFFKFMQMISRMKGAITRLNIDRMPLYEELSREPAVKKWIEDMQSTGILIEGTGEVNPYSIEGQKPPPAIEVTMIGMPPEVNMILEHINFLGMQIQEIMGFNNARTGGVSQYEKASNTMLNKTQSDYATANIDISFNRFCENTLTQVANLLKMSMFLKKKYGKPEQSDSLRLSIGDEFYDLIDDDWQFLFQDIGISFRMRKISDTDKMNKLEANMQIGLQQGKVDIYDMLEIMKFDDPNEAIEKVQRNIKEREMREEQMQQQQAQMQQQQAQMQQAQQGQQQQAMQAQQIDADQIKQAAGMHQQTQQNRHELLKETVGRALQEPKEIVQNIAAQ